MYCKVQRDARRLSDAQSERINTVQAGERLTKSLEVDATAETLPVGMAFLLPLKQ